MFSDISKAIIEAQVQDNKQIFSRINNTIMACILAMSKRAKVCIGDEQKANSLKGCWWGKTKCIIADGSLKRNMLFMATIKENKEEKRCVFEF
jgi:hypothetical protein